MRATAVSNSYARVLFDLANGAKKVDVVSANILALGVLCSKMHPVFVAVDRQAPISKKNEFLSVLLSFGKFDDITKKFLELLRLENKLSFLSDIANAFARLHRESEDVIEVKVRSVVELDKSAENKLTKFLNDVLKKEVSIENIVDQNIMGGVVIEIGSYVIDNSFVNKLRRIKLDAEKV